jgi:hypothetical protein
LIKQTKINVDLQKTLSKASDDNKYYEEKKFTRADIGKPPPGASKCSEVGGISHKILARHKLI